MEMRNIFVHRDQSRSFAGGRRRGGNVGTPPGCKRAAGVCKARVGKCVDNKGSGGSAPVSLGTRTTLPC
jgi:hypothetical protein